MSTKQTIKYAIDDDTGEGFHLYRDMLEIDDNGNGPVHLYLECVPFEAGAGGVDVTIPQDWAVALGLVAATEPCPTDHRTLVSQISELLAVIHMDGGHYTAEHGLEKSVADAQAMYCSMRAELAGRPRP